MTRKDREFMAHRRRTVKIAKELCYSNEVIRRLSKAMTESQLTNIMITARRSL